MCFLSSPHSPRSTALYVQSGPCNAARPSTMTPAPLPRRKDVRCWGQCCHITPCARSIVPSMPCHARPHGLNSNPYSSSTQRLMLEVGAPLLSLRVCVSVQPRRLAASKHIISCAKGPNTHARIRKGNVMTTTTMKMAMMLMHSVAKYSPSPPSPSPKKTREGIPRFMIYPYTTPRLAIHTSRAPRPSAPQLTDANAVSCM
jgi:hypothetical protein